MIIVAAVYTDEGNKNEMMFTFLQLQSRRP